MPETMELTAVQERVDYIWNTNTMVVHRKRHLAYHAVVNGTMPADLTEHMLKGQVIEMPSPRGNRVKRQLIAETSAYPNYVTVTAQNPDGNVTQPLKDQADKVERWDTLALDRLDSGKRVTNQVRDHQLASGWCVMLLITGEDEEFPWRVEVLGSDTCAVPMEKGGPFRPKYLARKFKMLVKDALDTYGAKKGKQGTYKDKKLRFTPLSYATSIEGTQVNTSSGGGSPDPGFAEEVTFFVLYTPEMTYHCCLDDDGKDGQIVWQQKNITGGVPAIVVPGDTNAIGGDGEEALPIMYEVLTILRSKNLCRAMLMTMAGADRPEMVINCTPEQLVVMQQKGLAVEANAAEVRAGGPRMLAISGEATNWVAAPNDALYKIDEQLGLELEQACGALVPSTDTQLAAASTAEAWHSVTGTQNRQQTPMLQHLAWSWGKILDMIHVSMDEYQDDFTLTASENVSRKHGAKSKQISAGTSVTLSPDDLNFKYTVTVATTQETEEQLQRKKQAAQLDYQAGIISFEQMVAVSYPDVDSQIEELLFDTAVSILDYASLTFLATAYQGELLTSAGIFMPMSAQTLMPPSMQPPPPALNAPQGGGGGFQPAPEAAATSGPVGAFS